MHLIELMSRSLRGHSSKFQARVDAFLAQFMVITGILCHVPTSPHSLPLWPHHLLFRRKSPYCSVRTLAITIKATRTSQSDPTTDPELSHAWKIPFTM